MIGRTKREASAVSRLIFPDIHRIMKVIIRNTDEKRGKVASAVAQADHQWLLLYRHQSISYFFSQLLNVHSRRVRGKEFSPTKYWSFLMELKSQPPQRKYLPDSRRAPHRMNPRNILGDKKTVALIVLALGKIHPFGNPPSLATSPPHHRRVAELTGGVFFAQRLVYPFHVSAKNLTVGSREIDIG